MQKLFEDITHITPQLSDWCPLIKAHTLAALVLALRPSVSYEIGVWQGASAIPMALAHKEIGHGILYAVDPWSCDESLDGQVTPQDKEWWGKVNHDHAYEVFTHYIHHYGVQNVVRIIRDKSDNVEPPDVIELLHIDGRHDEGAIRDVERFAPHVPLGKIVVMDDLDWVGGAVRKAEARLLEMGFVQLYKLGSGAVYQRMKWTEPDPVKNEGFGPL